MKSIVLNTVYICCEETWWLYPKGKKYLFDSQVIGGEDVNKLHYMCPWEVEMEKLGYSITLGAKASMKAFSLHVLRLAQETWAFDL